MATRKKVHSPTTAKPFDHRAANAPTVLISANDTAPTPTAALTLSPSGANLTVSSLEIAELTGKAHKNVVRDIRVMLTGLKSEPSGFEATYRDASGRMVACFNLPKRESLILASGYSVELRAKIIDRWAELEAERTLPLVSLPGDLVEEIHRILGINKMLSHKVTVIEQGMTQMREQYVSAMIALDPRVAALAYISVNEILDKEWRVPSKGRRSIQRKVLNRIKDHCATGEMKGTRAAYSGTWIFPRQEAIDFVREHCGSMIREHLDKVGRQGVLKLVQK